VQGRRFYLAKGWGFHNVRWGCSVVFSVLVGPNGVDGPGVTCWVLGRVACRLVAGIHSRHLRAMTVQCEADVSIRQRVLSAMLGHVSPVPSGPHGARPPVRGVLNGLVVVGSLSVELLATPREAACQGT
jgi:hypothetical protein